ncbi:hypothetical protein [Microbispora sp. NPDC049633]|uniref:hypothetical protein n=1 Tax=Microbispora sp. NPDC049633 TaxID=3154355 RepID=UPI00343E3AE5
MSRRTPRTTRRGRPREHGRVVASGRPGARGMVRVIGARRLTIAFFPVSGIRRIAGASR